MFFIFVFFISTKLMSYWHKPPHPSILMAGIVGTLRKKDSDSNEDVRTFAYLMRKKKFPRVLHDPPVRFFFFFHFDMLDWRSSRNNCVKWLNLESYGGRQHTTLISNLLMPV